MHQQVTHDGRLLKQQTAIQADCAARGATAPATALPPYLQPLKLATHRLRLGRQQRTERFARAPHQPVYERAMHLISRMPTPNPQHAGGPRHVLAQYPRTAQTRIGHALPSLAKGCQMQRFRWEWLTRRLPVASKVAFDPVTMPVHKVPDVSRTGPWRHDYLDNAIAEYPHRQAARPRTLSNAPLRLSRRRIPQGELSEVC